jgi:hypothetical protein
MIRKARARGQATLEFALVLPVIVALILGLELTGTNIGADVNVTNAAQAGAQAAADTLDEINSALSCAPPATDQCVTTAKNLITAMVHAALPCYPPAHSDTDLSCQDAVHYLGGKVATWGGAYCLQIFTALGGGCPLLQFPYAVRLDLLGNAANCETIGYDPSCTHAALRLAQAVMEAGLGCDGHTKCPDPLLPSGPPGPCCYPPPSCVMPLCSRPVMVELIGGFAQLGLACGAIRRSLGLDMSVATCEEGHVDPITGKTDNPWIRTTNVTGGMPYVLNEPCVGTYPTHPLLQTICPTGGTLVEQIEVHYQPPNSTTWVVATATAVPASQFANG